MAERAPRTEYGFGPEPSGRAPPAAPPTPFGYAPGGRAWNGGTQPAEVTNPAAYQPPYPWGPSVPATTPAAPAAPVFAGSPLNTLYGIDSESYLSDDQRKLARMIQGKFDSSMNRRDRELAQYGAPQLASFVEDEALARAMALARGLNIPTQDALGMVQGSGPASRGGTGGGGGAGTGARQPTIPRGGTSQQRIPAAARVVPPGASPSQAAKWQQIMGGLSSILPLLIGKTGMNSLMQDGIAGWLKGKYQEIFPGAVLDPAAASMLINQGVAPTVGGLALNPFTGMPIGLDPTSAGGGEMWGQYNTSGELMGPPAFYAGGEPSFDPEMGPPLWGNYNPMGEFMGPPAFEAGGEDYWGAGEWWNDPSFGGGEYWYPSWGEGFDFTSGDPFGVGGW